MEQLEQAKKLLEEVLLVMDEYTTDVEQLRHKIYEFLGYDNLKDDDIYSRSMRNAAKSVFNGTTDQRPS